MNDAYALFAFPTIFEIVRVLHGVQRVDENLQRAFVRNRPGFVSNHFSDI